MSKRAVLSVHLGKGGYWACLRKPNAFMYRGPYRWRWMATLAFPINRWIW